MKQLSLLFIVFLITSCSNEWEELGFNEHQEQKAKEMGFRNPVDYQQALDLSIKSNTELITFRDKAKENGFENPIDYQQALDLEINTFSQLIAFRDEAKANGFKNPFDYKEALSLSLIYDDWIFYKKGNFTNIEQFNYAKKYNLQSQKSVIWHKDNCLDTPSYGLLCSNSEKYNELGPRLEYHLTRLNRAIDETEIEVAIDCSHTQVDFGKRPANPFRANSQIPYSGDYRSIYLKFDSKLLHAREAEILSREFYQLNNKAQKIDGWRGYSLETAKRAIALIFYEQERRSYRRYPYVDFYDVSPHIVILNGQWVTDNDFHYFNSGQSQRVINRKTGNGKIKEKLIMSAGWISHAKEFACEPFEGNIKKFLKDDIFIPALKKVVSQQIEVLEKKQADELARKEKEEYLKKLEEERKKMENKF